MASVERYYLAMPGEKLRRARNAILYAVAGLPPAVIGCGLGDRFSIPWSRSARAFPESSTSCSITLVWRPADVLRSS